jgi:hypothetical protein
VGPGRVSSRSAARACALTATAPPRPFATPRAVPDGLPALPASGPTDDEQSGGVAGGGRQRAGPGQAEGVESPRRCRGDPAGASGVAVRGWPAGPLLRPASRRSLPPTGRRIDGFLRNGAHRLAAVEFGGGRWAPLSPGRTGEEEARYLPNFRGTPEGPGPPPAIDRLARRGYSRRPETGMPPGGEKDFDR